MSETPEAPEIQPAKNTWPIGLVIVVAVALAGTFLAKQLGHDTAQEGPTTQPQPQATVVKVFRIAGMHGDACAGLIRSKVEALPGVVSARVSYKESTARVTVGPSGPTEADLVSAVTAAGYRAEPARE